jgi:hypothetical protein
MMFLQLKFISLKFTFEKQICLTTDLQVKAKQVCTQMSTFFTLINVVGVD